jgi:hypothetical protein
MKELRSSSGRCSKIDSASCTILSLSAAEEEEEELPVDSSTAILACQARSHGPCFWCVVGQGVSEGVLCQPSERARVWVGGWVRSPR